MFNPCLTSYSFPLSPLLGLRPSSRSFVLPSFLVFCFLSGEFCHLCFLLLSFITVQYAAAILIRYEGVNVPRSHFVFCLAPPKRLEPSTGKLKLIPLQSHFSCPDYAQFPFNQGNELFTHLPSISFPFAIFIFPPVLKTLQTHKWSHCLLFPCF